MIFVAGLHDVYSASSTDDPSTSSFPDTGDLLLTNDIKKGQIEAARNKSRVLLFQNFSVDAFSGFITINETANTNLFFLLVVAEGNKSDAPLLLWTQGGPGQSALFAQFLQNGPVAFDYIQNFTPRASTLQKNMSILYLDLPVGAGFSFTDNETGYAKSLEDISDSVMVFFDQFLQLFPEYLCRDFYVGGESYAARYSIGVADALLRNTTKSLILRGTIGGNGFLGPILDIADSTKFLYWTSMLNESGAGMFSAMFDKMRALMQTENRTIVPYLLLHTIFADLTGQNPTLFQNLTSYNDHASPMYTHRPYNILACFFFLNSSSVIRQALHVAENRTFEYFNPSLATNLAADILRDISNITERVLNESNALLYTGQMDTLFPAVNQQAYHARLNWSQSEKYRSVQRTPWRPRAWNEYMGYAAFLKQVPMFTEAVLLGMSHYGGIEKPDEVNSLMLEFISNATRNASIPSEGNGVGGKVQR